ncbi:putative neutral ceramidase C [Tigriopus californicus]|uniref:putative neutral ceramidase C n=1 Tax=Tigriopus californicus TaxID=6832 RepID=UPI0027DA013E|nr:putative neutral ceramidase C [Tigriopus californicus]XP_059097867.1 putative neutral ceramidase C [Tigriopus californicus]
MSVWNQIVFGWGCLVWVKMAQCGYQVGVGIGDTTGPVVGIGMMGYAKAGQTTQGIHTRLFARAFFFQEEAGSMAVFVSVDSGMIGQLMKYEVIAKVRKITGLELRHDNLLLSATHTHSGPSGYFQYVLFTVGGGSGFVEQSFQAIVNGITTAIVRAYETKQPAKLFLAQSELTDSSINRSPSSYLRNPEEERQRYSGNTDYSFTQLNIMRESANELIGVINWFAVHATSMNNSNHLISGDNKGLASLILERNQNPPGTTSGKGPFVAAFASSNLGDVSPNLQGPRCGGTGLPCDQPKAKCCRPDEDCIAFGPGSDMFDSTYIIAQCQVTKAKELLASVDMEIKGGIASAHQWIDMTNQRVTLPDGSTHTTCKPALGYGFASGTTDGPGEPAFIRCRGPNNNMWNQITKLITNPSPRQKRCHYPKKILLNTGEMKIPSKWHPEKVDTQILKIGQLVIAAVPGEFTTMAGRRLRESIIASAYPDNVEVVIAGLSNVYTHYVTTYEEYQNQRYEGASTIYGPHTLRAYQQQYSYLMEKMSKREHVPYLKRPPNYKAKQIRLDRGMYWDMIPPTKEAGECVQKPPKFAYPGDTVIVKFVAGHPRNDLMLEQTFLKVEHQQSPNNWVVMATDTDIETKFIWKRKCLVCEGIAEIHWKIPYKIPKGTFRITHQGHTKGASLKPILLSYRGVCPNFQVVHGRRMSNAEEPSRVQNLRPTSEISWSSMSWRGFITKIGKFLNVQMKSLL